MYERLINKKEMPTIDEFLDFIGKRKELFNTINDFLINELNAVSMIKFDAHSRCWKMSYHVNRYYSCDIITENDAFTIVTLLSEESIKSIYDGLMPYAKECIDNSPYRHRGWIEYRVLSEEHIEDSKMILQTRANRVDLYRYNHFMIGGAYEEIYTCIFYNTNCHDILYSKLR